jgi:type I restriction enzyme S subunit
MNAERLLRHYDQIADSPDAIARLRRFILDLAVRGKLVPQDPNDEPASELLKRIAKEKARLVEAGEIKKAEAVANLTDSIHHFPAPPGWAITNLQSICNSVTDGDHLPPPKAESGIPFLVIGNVRGQRIEFEGSRFVPQTYYDALDPIRRPRSGDLLYTLVGSYGIPVIVRDDQPFCVQRHIGILRPSALIDVRFLARAMESRLAFDQATVCATGIAQKTVPLSGLRKLLLPLPPLAEQHRIVAKVDELMGLCDRLEAAREAREATRDRLAAASLARLDAPDPETFQADARFALDALPALTTRPDQIKELRQVILNLAVRGKLVPQDQCDEPAIGYLLGLSGVPAKTRKLLKPLDPSNCGGDLPASWAWLSLGAIISGMDAGWSPQCESYPRSSDEEWGVLKTTAVQALSFDAMQHKLLPTKLKPRPQYQAEIGDILVTRAGPKNRVGISCVVDVPCPKLMISDKLIRFHALGEISASYIALTLNAGYTFEQVEAAKSGMAVMQMNISQDKLRAIPIPLPPLAEQHRIVAKVDALMALCDRLEASLTATAASRRRLLDALLAEALTPADAREMEAAE